MDRIPSCQMISMEFLNKPWFNFLLIIVIIISITQFTTDPVFADGYPPPEVYLSLTDDFNQNVDICVELWENDGDFIGEGIDYAIQRFQDDACHTVMKRHRFSIGEADSSRKECHPGSFVESCAYHPEECIDCDGDGVLDCPIISNEDEDVMCLNWYSYKLKDNCVPSGTTKYTLYYGGPDTGRWAEKTASWIDVADKYGRDCPEGDDPCFEQSDDDDDDETGCGCSTENSGTGTAQVLLTLVMLVIGFGARRLAGRRSQP